VESLLVSPVRSYTGPSGATPLQAAPERTDVEFGKKLPEHDVAVSDETFRPQLGGFVAM